MKSYSELGYKRKYDYVLDHPFHEVFENRNKEVYLHDNGEECGMVINHIFFSKDELELFTHQIKLANETKELNTMMRELYGKWNTK